MPKKPNFLGGMQNYNKSTGEYEPNLVGPNGKVVKDADGDGVSHESKQEHDFNDPSERESLKAEEKEFNSKYDQIFDEDYQRSYGVPKFQDENDVKTLNDIVEKAMENGGDEGAIEISNNAIERLEELVEFSPEEQDKLASGTGEEIMEILRSKETKPMGTDRPEWANKIDKEMKPAFDSAKKLDSLYKNAKEKNLDFERNLLNDIKSNPEAYNKIVLGDKEYVRRGNGFDFYENGKHVSFGTVNSVAKDISDYYEDTETKLNESKEVSEPKEKPQYQNITDLSSSVKKELKEKGFNTKGISVRGRNVGYSDALDITIKDPNIDIDEVRKIVNKHESYERDASGDILQGGNRYVNVKYEYGLFDSIGEENKEEASKLIEQVKSGNGSGIELGNKHYLFHDKQDGQTFIHSNEYGMTPIYSPERLGSYLYQIKKFGRIVGR